MKISPIEKRITEAIEAANCKYESDVSREMRAIAPVLRAEFPNTDMTEIMYYLDKVTIAKKKAIRRNVIG